MVTFKESWADVHVLTWQKDDDIYCDVFPKLENALNYKEYLKEEGCSNITLWTKTIHLKDIEQA